MIHMSNVFRTIFRRNTIIATGVLVGLLSLPLITLGQEDGFNFGIGEFIWNVISQFIGGVILGFAGFLLDAVTHWTILDFGNLYRNYIGFAIENLWTFVRDLLNMLFIFGLVYIGFKVMLDANDSKTKQALGYLVAAALLINFSLFITKAVIDFSNFTAIQLAQLIQIDQADVESGLTSLSGAAVSSRDFTDNPGETGFRLKTSEAFMELTSLHTILSTHETDGFVDTDADITEHWGYILGVALFLLIAAFVFISGAIMLVIRFIAMVIFMILSPLMFLGWIFPGLSNYSEQYWSKFFRYAFYAPAYIFMLLLSFKVLVDFRSLMGAKGSPTTFAAAFIEGNNEGQFLSILYFTIACAFMFASLKIADMMGLKGSQTVMATGKYIRTRAQGAVGRATVGYASRGAGTAYRKFDAWQQSESKGAAGWTARTAAGLARRGAAIGSFGAITDQNIRDATKAGSNAKFGSSYSREDIVKQGKERSADNIRLQRLAKIRKGLMSGDENERHKALNDATAKDIEELLSSDKTLVKSLTDNTLGWVMQTNPNLTSLAGDMSQSQFDAVMKQDDIDDLTKEKMRKARSEAVTKTVNKEGIAKASIKQLEAIGADGLTRQEEGKKEWDRRAAYLNDDQMKDLKKSADINPSQYKAIEEARKNARDTLAKGVSAEEYKKFFEGMSAKNKAELPDDLLTKTSPEILRELDADVIGQMQSKNRNPETIQKVYNNLLNDTSGEVSEQVKNVLRTPHMANRYAFSQNTGGSGGGHPLGDPRDA